MKIQLTAQEIMSKCCNCSTELKNPDGLTTFIQVEDMTKKKNENILVWDAFAYIYGISWKYFQNERRKNCEFQVDDSLNSITAGSIAICEFCVPFLVCNYNAHQRFENSTDSISILQEAKKSCRKILGHSSFFVEGIYCPSPTEPGDQLDSLKEKQLSFNDKDLKDVKEEPIDYDEFEENDSQFNQVVFQKENKLTKIESKSKLVVKLERLSPEMLNYNGLRDSTKICKISNTQEETINKSHNGEQLSYSKSQVSNHEEEVAKQNGETNRKGTVSEWKRKKKYLRNSGMEYIDKRGKVCPGIKLCTGVKVCYKRCRKPGCLLTQERIHLCKDFWLPGRENYSRQNTILLSLLTWSVPHVRTVDEKASRRQATYRYYLKTSEGTKIECCMATFLDTFRITRGRLGVLQKRVREGIFNGEDGRGKHLNRPNRHPIEHHELVNEHINSIPIYTFNCCSESAVSENKFLPPDLNAVKMFNLFLQKYGHGLENLERLYKDTLRASGLRFAAKDKCEKCLASEQIPQKINNCDENPK